MIGLKEKQKIILKAVLEGKAQRQIAKEMKIYFFVKYENIKLWKS